jgi:nitrate reductase gamma subunit
LEDVVSTFTFFVGGILPYLAVIIFFAGMAYRIRVWIRTPQPGKMTLFPAADSTFRGVLAETLLFPSLFKGDKVLWLFSWLFHATLALVFIGHMRAFTAVIDRVLLSMGMTQAGIDTMSATSGGAAGIILLATGLLLLIRRFTIPRVREISGLPDFIAPLFLLAVIFSGNLMRLGPHFDLEQTRVWALSLLTFSPVIPQNGTFLVHAMLAFGLIMYIPFSKILHFGGIFFTQALVKRS